MVKMKMLITIVGIILLINATNVLAQDQLWSVRMAESVMTRHPQGYGWWDYVTGTVLRGFEELWHHTGDEKYYNYIQQTVDLSVASNGSILFYQLSDYNIDQINEGRMVLFMYKATQDNRYKIATETLRSQLESHPRTSEGGFWHKQRYPDQMWLDGLYMGSPFYAEYCVLFDESETLDDVVKQLTLMEKHARDSETGLLYHGWNETKVQDWADPVTGCSPSFWGRAVGWYAMAAVDVLDFLPEEHAGRDSVVAIVQRLAEAVVKVQDETSGVWWQVMDQGGREGNYLESSVSCMLVYMLAKSIRMGYIDESYWPAVEKAYQGILDEFITESTNGTINLTKTCRTAGLGSGRDGTYNYYVNETEVVTNDGKGVGPFITASVEIELHNHTIDVEPEKQPVQFDLDLANYPNPFNSGTNISYSIPVAGHVSLKIYNALGQHIATLTDEHQSAGGHTFSWHPESMNHGYASSGVYYAVLQTGSLRKNTKILYLK